MKIIPCGFRTRLFSAFSLILAAAALLGPSPASGQSPIQIFLTGGGTTGRSDLTDTNVGRSALAIQKTCGLLGARGGPNLMDPNELELWQRCNELVATADNFNGGTTFGRFLGYTEPNELLAAFQQVNGEEVQALANMAHDASYNQFSIIAARLAALRGATSTSIASVTAYGADLMYGTGGGAAADDTGLPFGSWGWFFRGSYTTGDKDASDPTGFTGEENGFEFDQYGLTIGIDHMSGSSVWGVALSYSSYEVEMTNRSAGAGIQTQVVNEGEIEADSVNGSFFYDHTGQNNVYFSALAGYGVQSFDMARNFIYFSQNTTDSTVVDQTRSLIAAPDGDSVAASLTLGRAINRGGFVIDPHIGVTYDRVTIDRFTEVDSGNLTMGQVAIEAMHMAFDEQEIDSLRVNIGIQFSDNVNTSFGSVRPTFSFDWYHEFEDDPRVIKVKYALEDQLADQGNFITGFDNCVSCFSLTSEAPDSDFFVVGAGIAASYRSGFQAFLMFEGLLDYENVNAFAVTVGLRGQF